MAKSKKKKTVKKTKKTVKKTVKKAVKKVAKKVAKKIVKKSAKKSAKKSKKPARASVFRTPETTDTLLKKGDMAPNFRIPNDSGHESGLSDFIGRQVVLYFYPKDDTPDCTVEAGAFRDGLDAIAKRGASVVGINCDSIESHKAFREKYGLNFHLLSDTRRDVVEKYGVWKDNGIERTTFVIDENGRIKKVFPDVDVKTHYQDVLKALG